MKMICRRILIGRKITLPRPFCRLSRHFGIMQGRGDLSAHEEVALIKVMSRVGKQELKHRLEEESPGPVEKAVMTNEHPFTGPY